MWGGKRPGPRERGRECNGAGGSQASKAFDPSLTFASPHTGMPQTQPSVGGGSSRPSPKEIQGALTLSLHTHFGLPSFGGSGAPFAHGEGSGGRHGGFVMRDSPEGGTHDPGAPLDRGKGARLSFPANAARKPPEQETALSLPANGDSKVDCA